ncbi:ABC-F family ATP-binding cassette domain-containing protein [Fluviispira multicolorata]|uniref:ATP-binding cassette domain-containing protein n=1 Tax=Fluviispira multicolorata TaxID=2654512 RepID=A0A833N4T8_9BACT|nr:ATP-binding cassette domain-containing protein [Fluviispira multicolorata]KAB8031778.1 ATP-binding cassette domain-containing protein [Fluviispira multicolorata]
MSSLISAHGISLELPDGTLLFKNFTFQLGKEKVGIIGRNGLGKTSLLRIIFGEIKPTAGTIIIEGKVSYLPQKLSDFSKNTIVETLNAYKKLNALSKADQGTANIEDLIEISDDWDYKFKIQSILDSLNLFKLNLNRLVTSLSGGELMRVLFARLLLENPDLILLDEPTNNLDTESKKQFFNSIKSSKNAFLIVSHDRELLKEMIICKNLNYKFSDQKNFLWENNLNFNIIGNKRVSISGKNGSGKTTLINIIVQNIIPTVGEIKIGSKNIAILDQKCSIVNDDLSILENLKYFAPIEMKEYELRIRAGRFLFYGDDIYAKVKFLSGGERLRLAIACLLAASNSPDILILDEPTNNLDIESIEILTESLNKYTGVLIVISHDRHFLNEININMKINL